MEAQRNKGYQHLGGFTMEISDDKKKICINSANLGQKGCLPHLLANFVKYQTAHFPYLYPRRLIPQHIAGPVYVYGWVPTEHLCSLCKVGLSLGHGCPSRTTLANPFLHPAVLC